MKKATVAIILLVLLLPGCCAYFARNEFFPSKPKKPPTPVFGGTVTAAGMLACCLASPVASLNRDMEPWAIATAPLFAVDLPLSFVADILYLPYDINAMGEDRPRRVAVRHPRQPPSASGWPFDAAEAKRRQNEAAKALGVEPEQVVQITPGVTITMVLVPAGEFIMADPGGVQTHVIISKPFWLGKHEVTQQQYRAVMGQTTSKFEGATNPAEQLTWYKTQEFLKKLNSLIGGAQFVLPTEAQWEYACRAGSASRFCFGDAYELLPQYAWCGANSGATTHPAGTRLPNAWGIHDMHGNVAEWCQDWCVGLGEGTLKDPRGPADQTSRAVRGGAWTDAGDQCLAGYRQMLWPAHEAPRIGFRVARLVP